MSTAKATQTTTTAAAAAKAHETIDRIAVHAEKAEENIRAKAGEVDDSVKAQYAQARVKGQQACDAVSTYVKENPMTSLGIAFGAGVLLTALLRRK
ncbi:hypothetical protein C4K68_19055 [Pokkaliibacter plantistimulans]|uniref:DUF883 domain-containing protein n=1 Tax=Proteobacteria bacterium 228 TaxID=2083153 RepID=A0A2S5KLN1_9PROT|nr:DUF883 family protein [Pokkaliibacter plantistimulans]PPC75731.1 hypothetical protein C4K68_19055 [Pokkaliibacter plantistimulans]